MSGFLFERRALGFPRAAGLPETVTAVQRSRHRVERPLLISKILTLNKLHILENLCGYRSAADAPALDYFHVGEPLTNPPRIRGSMILKLRLAFLRDNEEFFAEGSPIDTGAIRFGLLAAPDVELLLAHLACDHRKFSRVIDDLSRLPGDALSRIAHHRKAPEAAGVLGSHFDQMVVEAMLSADEPVAWMFEFSLRKGYGLTAEHIEEVLFPNTYADVPIFRELRRRIGARAREFNPRFGMESVCR